MTRIRFGILGAAVIALLAACTHDNAIRSGTAAGVLMLDSMPSTPNAVVLRVQNNFSAPVRVLAEANDDTNEVMSVAAGDTRMAALGPQIFRFALTTIELRPMNDSASTFLGPINVAGGDRVRIVVAPDLKSSHVYQNGNW